MLLCSIWTLTESTTLKESCETKISEFVLLPKTRIPNVTTDNAVKLEGYVLLYDKPTTISVSTNGQFEVYLDDIVIIKSVNNGNVTVHHYGILPFECYIRPSSNPVSINIEPTFFVLNNGIMEFRDPKPVQSKSMTFTFANPERYIEQKYYIGDRELETVYKKKKSKYVKLTEITVIIPPDIE